MWLGKEEKEFVKGGQKAVTCRSTREGEPSRSPRFKRFMGVKFPDTERIKQEQNEGERSQEFQCANVDSDRLHDGPNHGSSEPVTLPRERDFADGIKSGIWRAGHYLGLSQRVTVNTRVLKNQRGRDRVRGVP